MKIEKLNDHQIRCILTKEDLAMRQIKLSELAYGTEKAKSLFRDMMQQAAADFGFEAEDIPLMIEAIPLSSEKIVLIITKVETPDELDTRFSNFTHPDEEEEEGSDAALIEDRARDVEDITSDLLNLFARLKTGHDSDGTQQSEKSQAETAEITRLFSFDDLDDAIEAAKALHGFYNGENTLYKDRKEGLYHLVLQQSGHTISDFNKVNNIVSAYLTPKKYTPGMQAYFAEHLKVILSGNALQSLAKI